MTMRKELYSYWTLSSHELHLFPREISVSASGNRRRWVKALRFWFLLGFNRSQQLPLMSNNLTRQQVAAAQIAGDYALKPETAVPQLDTSQWPLLLKNYDQLLVRSSHFTPIPSGCSPLKRDIQSYIKSVWSSLFT